LEFINCLLGINKKHYSWQLSELVFLMENYDKLSFVKIASIIGRTEPAIRVKASYLGLIKREGLKLKKINRNGDINTFFC